MNTTRIEQRSNLPSPEIRISIQARCVVFAAPGFDSASTNQMDIAALLKAGEAAREVATELQNPAIHADDNLRKAHLEKLESHGETLFHFALRQPRNAEGLRYGDIWKEALANNAALGVPTIVHLKGAAGAIPWEFVRLPADQSPTGQDEWLGDLCVFCVIPDGVMDAKLVVDSDGFRGAAIYGEHRAFLEAQRNYLSALLDGDRPLFRSPNPLSAADLKNVALAKANAEHLQRFFSEPDGLHCITVAAHSTEISQKDLRGVVRPEWAGRGPPLCKLFFADNCETTDLDLGIAGETLSELLFGFLNTCSSFQMNGEDPKVRGLAGRMMDDLGAKRVVAAMCEINSEGAHIFGRTLFEHWLPVGLHGAGLELGDAVFKAREACRAAGFVTGLCYRIVGRHDLALEPFQGSPRSAPFEEAHRASLGH